MGSRPVLSAFPEKNGRFAPFGGVRSGFAGGRGRDLPDRVERFIGSQTDLPRRCPTEGPAEKIYQASFRVRSSIGKLKALKEFLVNGGYEYEQF